MQSPHGSIRSPASVDCPRDACRYVRPPSSSSTMRRPSRDAKVCGPRSSAPAHRWSSPLAKKLSTQYVQSPTGQLAPNNGWRPTVRTVDAANSSLRTPSSSCYQSFTLASCDRPATRRGPQHSKPGNHSRPSQRTCAQNAHPYRREPPRRACAQNGASACLEVVAELGADVGQGAVEQLLDVVAGSFRRTMFAVSVEQADHCDDVGPRIERLPTHHFPLVTEQVGA